MPPPKKSTIPWGVGLPGKNNSQSADAPIDSFWDSMASLAKMKTAAQAGNLLQDPARQGNSVSEMTEVAKAFGINVPEMAKEQNRLLQQLNEAQQQARSAEGKAEYSRLENLIENIKTNQNPAAHSDPLREMAIEMAKSAISRQNTEKEKDPVSLAYEQFIMNKTLSDLEGSQNPPTVAAQVGSAVETLRAIKELSTAFTPPPPPPQALGMTPEKNLELELKKLEVEQQIEMYRIQKQNENDAKKAAGLHEAVQMIGGAIESIGKSVASSLIQANVGNAPAANLSMSAPQPNNFIDDSEIVQPSAMGGNGSGADDNPLVGQLDCPDCGQQAVYVTQDLYNKNISGEAVNVVCVSCGAQHVLEGVTPPDGAEVPPTAFSVPEVPSTPAEMATQSRETAKSARTAKERPPRRNFVSVD